MFAEGMDKKCFFPAPLFFCTHKAVASPEKDQVKYTRKGMRKWENIVDRQCKQKMCEK